MIVALWTQTSRLAIHWQWSMVMRMAVFLNGHDNFTEKFLVSNALYTGSAIGPPTNRGGDAVEIDWTPKNHPENMLKALPQFVGKSPLICGRGGGGGVGLILLRKGPLARSPLLLQEGSHLRPRGAPVPHPA